MASKAGVLDNPSLYDARSKAVYARSGGFFFLLDGARVAVGGTQRWTTNEGVAMRGANPHVPLAGEAVAVVSEEAHALGAIEEEELAMAIAASLADADGAHDPQEEDVAMPEAAPDGAPTEPAQERTAQPNLPGTFANLSLRFIR